MGMDRIVRLAFVRIGIILGLAVSGVAQNPAPATAGPPTTNTVPTSPKKKAVRKPGNAANGAMQTIPLESAPPSPPSPTETEAQKAADQKLLQQQQAQSAQAAKVTDQQVNTAQQRIDRIQSEQRIQDAPGPAQTGVVPAAGPPVQPANTVPAQPAAPVTPPSTPPRG